MVATRMVDGRKESCTKDFIDCAKHPVDTFAGRVSANAARKQAAEEATLLTKLNEAQAEYKKAVKLGFSGRNLATYEHKIKVAEAELGDTEFGLKKAKSELTKLKREIKNGTVTPKDLQKMEKNRNDVEYRISQKYKVFHAQAAKEEEFLEMKAEAGNQTSYQKDLASLMLRDGEIQQEQYWGGPTNYYGAKEHFDKCGVLSTDNVEENYNWSTHDTFTSEEYYGLKAELTCNCGKLFKATAVIENKDFAGIMVSLMNINNKKNDD